MQAYVIQNQKDKSLYWHNDFGWVSLGEATRFMNNDELLPMEGRWVEWPLTIADTPIDDCEFREQLTGLGAYIDHANRIPRDIELGALEPTIHQVTLRFDQPVIFANVIMRNLGEPESMDEDEKLYWAKIALEIGPDWIAKFRRIGAFMAAFDKA